MSASRLACAIGVATLLLLSACDDPATAAVHDTRAGRPGPAPARLVTTLALDESGAADARDEPARAHIAGMGIRPTGSTANGLTP
ncbi:MAG TPA: hypothetical protein VFX50_12715 [Gemmatimonadales bacterium]|nr:hypothetical protein [Gemmatimonadales bacterium]